MEVGITVKTYQLSCFRVGTYVLCPIREVLEQVCVHILLAALTSRKPDWRRGGRAQETSVVSSEAEGGLQALMRVW